MKILIGQKLKITSETIILLFQKPFINFDKNNLVIEEWINNYFDLKLSYSYDNINWSNPELIENFFIDNDSDIKDSSIDKEIYISLYLIKKILETNNASTLFVEKNTETQQQEYIIKGIGYKNKNQKVIWYNLDDDSLIKYKIIDNITNRYPKWNLYDNQTISIKRWKDQMNSISEMYGHTVIYFKAEPIETIHTFSNHVLKGISIIKKIKILVPNNELPQDRQTFTDWDIMLQDDFMIHIVTDIFEKAFGENSIPNENDIIYFPLLRKLYKVSSMQPKNGFMGKIGWWETYLAKYEENECVVINDELKNSLKPENQLFNFKLSNDFSEGIDYLDKIPKSENLVNVLNELENVKNETIYDSELIDKNSIEEKKQVTQNFTNKLEDSSAYISLKETEYQRDLYNKRLKIVEVNPDSTSYPITMYDATTVETRILAMSYNLNNLTQKNKFNLKPKNILKFEFDYVLLNRFSGEIFDIVYDNLPLITFEQNKRKILIKYNTDINEINYNFELKEFYRVETEFNLKLNQFSIHIYKLKDKQKYLEFHDLYIFKNILSLSELTDIFLYGGNYYVSNIKLLIDDNKIMEDYANPILEINKYNLQ